MKSSRIYTNVVLLLALLFFVSSFAFSQDLTVLKTETPIVIDGLASDAIWAQVEPNLVDNPYVGEPDNAADSQGQFKMVWDDTYLYFICEVNDLDLFEDSEGANEHDESFDLFFDRLFDGGTSVQEDDALITLEWSSTGVCLISGEKGTLFTAFDTTGLIAKCSETDNGYIIEAGIPMEMLEFEGGYAFGFDIRINDDDDGGSRDTQIAWHSDNVNDWANPSALAEVALSEDVVSAEMGNSIPMTDTPIVVDGLADDFVWSQIGANLIDNPYVGTRDDAADSEGRFKMAWDDTYLYFICEVNDLDLFEDSEGANEHDESFDLFIDRLYDGGTSVQEDDALITLEWSSTGTCLISGEKGGFTPFDTTGLIAKCSETDYGYIIEAAIPMEMLEFEGGYAFGFDIRINDDDDGGSRDTQIAWHSENVNDWANPSALAEMELSLSKVVTSVATEGVSMPETLELAQNYPNPFNPSTTIRFTVAHPSHIKLAVFDLLGKQVASLVDEVKSAGNYSVNFDATTLGNGVYFYQLQAGEQIVTKRMLLIK